MVGHPRRVPDSSCYGATAGESSSLTPLLNTNDWEDTNSEASMDSKDPDRVGSKTRMQEYSNEDMPGSGYHFDGLNLAETEGRVGFRGLFDNKLV